MDADSFFIERDPENAHRTPRAGRQHIKMTASLTMLQHFFVVAEPGPFRNSLNFPISNRRNSLGGSDGDWISRG